VNRGFLLLLVLDVLAGCSRSSRDQVGEELKCRSQMVDLSGRLDRYRLDVGKYPTTKQGLMALLVGPEDFSDKWDGPYTSLGAEDEDAIPLDPWGNEYQYERVTPETFSLWSMGPDGVSGTEDDVTDGATSAVPSHRSSYRKSSEVAGSPGAGLPTIRNSIGMQLAMIPAGEFLMGSDVTDRSLANGEIPQHRVRITNPFYLGIHEGTQGQFRLFTEESGHMDDATEWRREFPTENRDHPAVLVSWQDAEAFCKWLSTRDGRTYRLPIEAEWEYACRAGRTGRYGFDEATEDLENCAWYDGNSRRSAHPVGRKEPNRWGLYDMHGNVAEWCADWWDAGYYAKTPLDDPTGPPSGTFRVLRGGSWYDNATMCRAAYRGRGLPSSRYDLQGFRVASVPASASRK